MVAMAALDPTKTPAPMMPPMEIITRWRARRDFESLSEAVPLRGRSVAFKGFLVVWRVSAKVRAIGPGVDECEKMPPSFDSHEVVCDVLQQEECSRRTAPLPPQSRPGDAGRLAGGLGPAPDHR